MFQILSLINRPSNVVDANSLLGPIFDLADFQFDVFPTQNGCEESRFWWWRSVIQFQLALEWEDLRVKPSGFENVFGWKFQMMEARKVWPRMCICAF